MTGGKDSGAVGNGEKEKDIALLVTLAVGQILERHGVDVSYSRRTDTFVGLSKRASMATDFNANVFVSIHCNSFSNTQAQGVEVFSYPNSKNGERLAGNILDEIINDELYTKNRGLKTANFAVLRQTSMPSALVELGFISNKEDIAIMVNKQDELALAVAKGILNNLGLPYKGSDHMVTKTKIKLNGKIKEVDRIEVDGNNFIKLQDLRDGKIIIDYDGVPIIKVR